MWTLTALIFFSSLFHVQSADIVLSDAREKVAMANFRDLLTKTVGKNAEGAVSFLKKESFSQV
jgi:hypothetical protein